MTAIPTCPPCPVCGDEAGKTFCEIGPLPIQCNVFLHTRSDALAAPAGEITLAFCGHCGHIWNTRFAGNRVDYSPDYENSLHFSPHFQRYAEALADHLITRFGLRDRDVIEIGCGKGDFLALLCERGGNRGLGFDASFDPARHTGNRPINVVRDHYGPRYRTHTADLICCRHVLEHIDQPAGFLAEIQNTASARPGCGIYFEVPNVLYTLKDLGIWDVIYEHCGYFSPQSLHQLFLRQGFAVTAVYPAYDNQFLCLEGHPGGDRKTQSPAAAELATLERLIMRFDQYRRSRLSQLQEQLLEFTRSEKRMAVWGAGSKGVTFLNVMPAASAIAHVFDLNPNKHGRFIPGTGHQVTAPDSVSPGTLDVVFVMNPAYCDEITTHLGTLGHSPQIVAV